MSTTRIVLVFQQRPSSAILRATPSIIWASGGTVPSDVVEYGS